MHSSGLSRPRIASRTESGLLKDLLEHVVRIIAFLDVLGGELDFADLVIAALRRRAN